MFSCEARSVHPMELFPRKMLNYPLSSVDREGYEKNETTIGRTEVRHTAHSQCTKKLQKQRQDKYSRGPTRGGGCLNEILGDLADEIGGHDDADEHPYGPNGLRLSYDTIVEILLGLKERRPEANARRAVQERFLSAIFTIL